MWVIRFEEDEDVEEEEYGYTKLYFEEKIQNIHQDVITKNIRKNFIYLLWYIFY